MTRSIAWGLAATLAVGLLALVLTARRAPDSVVSPPEVGAPAPDALGDAADPPAQRPPARAEKSSPAPRLRDTVRAFAPLPPLDTRLADIIAELDERASAGDAAAACRLAAEIARCASVVDFDAERVADTLFLSVRYDEHGERHVERSANYIEQRVAEQERCRGVDAAVLMNQARFDLAAARLGDLDAAFRFVSADALDTGTLVRFPELLQLYRQNAWPLFQRLLEGGYPYAPGLWGRAIQLRSNPLGAVMPPEWNRPEVARALYDRVVAPPQYPTSPPPPSPEAVAEADRLFLAYFADAPLERRGPLPPPPIVDPAGCEQLTSADQAPVR